MACQQRSMLETYNIHKLGLQCLRALHALVSFRTCTPMPWARMSHVINLTLATASMQVQEN